MGGNLTEYSQDDVLDGEKRVQYEAFIFVVYTCITGPLILAGLVANATAFCIFGKMVHQNATTFLLRTLAVTDSCVMLCMIPRLCVVVLELYKEHSVYTIAETLSPILVAYITPLWYIVYVASVWTSVIIGMNRYIAVCRPLHAARLCTINQARKQILCVILGSIVYALPRFFAYTVGRKTDGSTFIAIAWIDNKWYYYIYYLGFYFTFIFIIPFGMLIFFCVRLITALRGVRTLRVDFHGTRRVDTKVTSMLVVLLVVSLVCHTANILDMILHLAGLKYIWGFIYAIADISVILNSSLNCVIYLVYIKTFRVMLCKICNNSLGLTQDYELS